MQATGGFQPPVHEKILPVSTSFSLGEASFSHYVVSAIVIDLLSYKGNLHAFMHVHANDAVISQSNSIANIKSLPPII